MHLLIGGFSQVSDLAKGLITYCISTLFIIAAVLLLITIHANRIMYIQDISNK